MTSRIRRLRPALFASLLIVLLVVATAATTVVLTRAPTQATDTAAAEPVRVAVIGDSYTSGLGNTVVWPTLIANSTRLGVANFAVAGSGYVGGTGESGAFADQVSKALAVKADAIVIFGGINDVGKSTELIEQAAVDLFTDLARRAPRARIIVVGPLWHEDPPPAEAVLIDDAVASAAAATNTTYLQVIEETWLVAPGLIQADDIHPSDEGQAVLATELGSRLLLRLPAHPTSPGD